MTPLIVDIGTGTILDARNNIYLLTLSNHDAVTLTDGEIADLALERGHPLTFDFFPKED